jgi:DNA-binding response OmpR family regulator
VLSVRAAETRSWPLLDAGANDYVTKPFGVQELFARYPRAAAPARRAGPRVVEFDDGNLASTSAARGVADASFWTVAQGVGMLRAAAAHAAGWNAAASC